jgi:hypothetical protein
VSDACSAFPLIEQFNCIVLRSGAHDGKLAVGPPTEINCHAQSLSAARGTAAATRVGSAPTFIATFDVRQDQFRSEANGTSRNYGEINPILRN